MLARELVAQGPTVMILTDGKPVPRAPEARGPRRMSRTGEGLACSIPAGAAVGRLAALARVMPKLVGGFDALGTLTAISIMILPAAATRVWAVGIRGSGAG